jgi:hypothetical protein
MKLIAICLLFILGLCGCQTSEITDYSIFDYDNSKTLVKENSPSLTPYTINGTTIIPILKHADHDSQVLHLCLWGNDNVFTVENVSFIGGTDYIIETHKKIDMATFRIEPDGCKSFILFSNLDNSSFDPEDASVKIAITIEIDKQKMTLEYPVTKSKRTYMVQR